MPVVVSMPALDEIRRPARLPRDADVVERDLPAADPCLVSPGEEDALHSEPPRRGW